jgi:hypothetical protein
MGLALDQARSLHPQRHLGHRRGRQLEPARDLAGSLTVLTPEQLENVLLTGAHSMAPEGCLARLHHRPLGVPERCLEIVVGLNIHPE